MESKAEQMTLAEVEKMLEKLAREYLSPVTTGKRKYYIVNKMPPYIIRWQALTGRIFQIGKYR